MWIANFIGTTVDLAFQAHAGVPCWPSSELEPVISALSLHPALGNMCLGACVLKA